MSIIYNIMLMYALAFIIGLFVSCIIWLLYTGMTTKSFTKTIQREPYSEIKSINTKNKST